MRNKELLVSVCMITYNHEKFISEAIEGVLMQKTTFPIELIIGEDCSTDTTRSICIDYQKKYPEIIKLQLPETNKGMMRNFIENMQAATGKYIALCEGDDYWTDPYKLQKQVDFLEANPEYSIIFHNAHEKIQATFQSKPFSIIEDREYSGGEIIINWIIPTASVLFKRHINIQFKYQKFLIFGDTPLFLKLLEYGKMYGSSDIMSVYRRHENGAVFYKNEFKKLIKHLKYLNLEFDNKYSKSINYFIARRYFNLARQSYQVNIFKTVIFIFKSIIWDYNVFFKLIKNKIVN